MSPQVPEGQCVHCQAPIIDLFAEWTEEYETAEGKRAILAGEIVFDCYYCQGPIQLRLPLGLIFPMKQTGAYHVAKRRKAKCQEWLHGQHSGQSLSQFVEMAGLQHRGKWAFDGYNWQEGEVHEHAKDSP